MENIDNDEAGEAIRMERLSSWMDAAGCVRDLTSDASRQYVFIARGCAELWIDGEPKTLSPGAILIVPAGARCTIACDRSAEGMWLSAPDAVLHFRVMPSLLPPSPQYWATYHNPMVVDCWTGRARRKDRTSIMRELAAARERLGGYCDVAVLSYIFVILLAPVLRPGYLPSNAAKSVPGRSKHNLVMRFRGLVERHFREHLTIEDYCRELAVTHLRLARACKSLGERSPLEIVQERLFLEARRELIYSDRSISEIAYRLGFREVPYFSRRFKEYVGRTPRDFRHLKLPIH